ncbi:hypothetical protein PVAND_013317 [Polypedilum vanderplanki]|uniref:Uncharacterized protein n=1 Tax=Polypedilum vanderplanki TaxID=319348 RepID=A0A9J6CQA4_POLVA|nr:hypothetical protein PVAND_013317 [Polypedilum vanderplanki]
MLVSFFEFFSLQFQVRSFHKPPYENDRDKINIAYDSMSSFYKFQELLKNNDNFVVPEQMIVIQKTGTIYKHGRPIIGEITEKVSRLSIKHQLNAFLLLPKVLDDIVNHMKNLENSSKIKNIIQGKSWKKIKTQFTHEDIILPLILYFDEFEPDNPLSSNAGNNKICGFYFSVPVIPQHLLSKTEFIFVTQLCLTKIKDENLFSCLNPIINELKCLEQEGLTISQAGEEKKYLRCSSSSNRR